MNLLITGAWKASKEQLSEIEAMGHSIALHQNESDPLPVAPEWVEGVIANGLFLHHPIQSFPSLRYIQLTSAGFDRVPLSYIEEHRIQIRNARGVYSIPMAEFALCGVLQLCKHSRFFLENQKAHRWEKDRGLTDLYQKTVLIVGAGSVGSACAQRFSALGCRVIGTDLYPQDNEAFAKVYPLSQLNSLLEDADVVILTLPLTEESRNLFDKDRLSKMKQDAILVNIARGGIIDTAALISLLPTHLGGAVLDVFEEEPLACDSPLWDMENVILTPHNSFVSDKNGERLFTLIKNNLEKTNL